MKVKQGEPWTAWALLAEDAEQRGDWELARECWYRAAEDAGTDGDRRARYNAREDHADAMWRKYLQTRRDRFCAAKRNA